MDIKPKNIIVCFLVLAFLSGLGGCAQKIEKKPMDQESVQEPVIEKPEPEPEKVSLIQILMIEAEKFLKDGNNQDALFIYNQALAQAEIQDREMVLSGIEKALIKTSPRVIEEFIQIKNLNIPNSLLQYWLGLNLAAQNNYTRAGKALKLFMDNYPDHAYAQDVLDLLAGIKLATFKKDTIGCLLPLSGKYKIFGQRALKGIQLAVQDLSEIHGKKFNVIIKDTQSNPERALECVDELGQKKVMGIVGPLLTVDSAGIQAEKLGIPIIAMTQKDEFPLKGDYLFSNFITPQMQVQSLASYIFMELGIKKVAILYPDERYGKRYMELFWDVVDEFNGEVVGVESYDGKNTDFTIPIKKLTGEYYPLPGFLKPEIPESEIDHELKDSEGMNPDLSTESENLVEDAVVQDQNTEKKPIPVEEKIQIDFQALFIPDSPSRVNLILPQLAYYDAKGMVLLGTNLWHQKSLLAGSKGYNKKAVITDGYFGNSKKEVIQDFEKRFNSLFEESPGFIEAIAYDTTSILFSAAMDDRVDSRESLKNALQGTRMFEGVTGNTIFDKTGNAHKQLSLITIKGGKFMEISH
ncbi:MAG: hypothetical protein B6230_04220 [Desulfobacteraceae bacterium 4572_89]|nr:MAG: hypothetical protein B6230_04220 [Desulfobacteraceae bacterium 4572_89]